MGDPPQPPAVRWEMISAVLEGARGVYRVLLDLTEEELHAALDLEYAVQRRHTVMNRLIARAAALQRARLTKRYLG